MRSPLETGGAQRLSNTLLLPLRREVGVFRFSSVRLDVRENSMRINQTLAAMFRLRCGGEPPIAESEQWKQWLLSELGTVRSGPCGYEGLPPEAAETLLTFPTIPRIPEHIHPHSLPPPILTITPTAP